MKQSVLMAVACLVSIASADQICCMAMTPACQACKKNMSVEDYCKIANDAGCANVLNKEKYNCYTKEVWSDEKT